MKKQKTLRLAVLGLDSGFFPEMWTLWVQLGQHYPWFNPPFPKATVTAAATLGRSDEEIKKETGKTGPREFAERYGVTIYDDANELFDKEKPDGVFVCGRPSIIPGIARRAIERGIHVYLQKPAGTDEGELFDLARLADENGVRAAAGQTWRFDPAVVASKEQLKEADIGGLCSLRIMYNHGMPGSDRWYFNPGEGGPSLWLGWYPIDLLLHFTESRVKKLFATGHRGDGSAPRERTIIHATCEFENGIIGSFDFYGNIRYPYARAEWELLGEHGLIRNIQRNDVEIYQAGKPQQAMYRNAFFDGLAQDINVWLHSWETGTTPGMTLTQAAETVRVANAVQQSLDTGKAVSL